MTYLGYGDVLLTPLFSRVQSRRDVDLSVKFANLYLKIPIISAPMDTVTSWKMCGALAAQGAIGCLHRFCTIEQNINMFNKSIDYARKLKVQEDDYTIVPIVSIGLGNYELTRADALVAEGATCILIDVANGASTAVCKQYDALRERLPGNASIIVGNFATKLSILQFNEYSRALRKPDAYRVGLGSGSVCQTRIATGCGMPAFASILECVETGFPIIACGGIRNSGDAAKALAAGAKAVICGSILAATNETPGKKYYFGKDKKTTFKKYRGSASLESYKKQKKVSPDRAAEGVSTWVLTKGPVKDIVNSMQAGLKSAFSYTNSLTLEEFQNNAKFIQISNYGAFESEPHALNQKLK